jgi:hypothetical protein
LQEKILIHNTDLICPALRNPVCFKNAALEDEEALLDEVKGKSSGENAS